MGAIVLLAACGDRFSTQGPVVGYKPLNLPIKISWQPDTGNFTITWDPLSIATLLGTVTLGAQERLVAMPQGHELVVIHGSQATHFDIRTEDSALVSEGFCGTQTTTELKRTVIEVTESGPCEILTYAKTVQTDPLSLGRSYLAGPCEGYLVLLGTLEDELDDLQGRLKRLLDQYPNSGYVWNGRCRALDAFSYSVAYRYGSAQEACAARSGLIADLPAGLPEEQLPAVRSMSSQKWTGALCS